MGYGLGSKYYRKLIIAIETVYLNDRLQLASECHEGIVVSLHMNSYYLLENATPAPNTTITKNACHDFTTFDTQHCL